MTDSFITPVRKDSLVKELALTYDTTADVTSWELYQQYQDYVEYIADNPEAGRNRVARNMTDESVPPSRVRGWLNGGMPDAVRGIQTCVDCGWLDLTWDDETLHNLTLLIAWIFAGGSINKSWVPSLAATDSVSQERAVSLLNTLNTNAKTIRTDDDHRATEVRPTKTAAPLGRLLSVLGAPVGIKNGDTQLSLPAWLNQAPHDLRLKFARTYVWQRGTGRDDRPSTPIQLSEERPLSFRREIQNFLRGMTDAEVTADGSTVTYLKPAGAELFAEPPTVE